MNYETKDRCPRCNTHLSNLEGVRERLEAGTLQGAAAWCERCQVPVLVQGAGPGYRTLSR